MTIAHDAASEVTAGTGDLSWTHTPVGTPKGVVVYIVQSVGVTDEIVGVTYGGVAMTEMAGSPLVHNASGTTDDGVVYGYFLGASIPSGAQTVAVDANATASSKKAWAATVTAAADTEIEDTTATDDVTGTTANPACTLTTGVGVVTQCYGGVFGGSPGVGDYVAGTGTTIVLQHDFGQHTGHLIRSTATDPGSDFTLNLTCLADDFAILGAAIKESAGGGTEHFGAADLQTTASIVVAAKKDAKAATATPVTASIVVVSKKDAKGATAVPLTATVVTAAKKDAHGAADLPLALDRAVVATKTAHGATVVPIVFTVVTDGTTGGTITGALSLVTTFGATVAGKRDAHGASAVPLTATITTAGKRDAHGSAAFPISFSVSTATVSTTYGAFALPIVFTVATSGGTPSPEPNLDAVLTGWLAGANAGGYLAGVGANGRILQPETGSLA